MFPCLGQQKNALPFPLKQTNKKLLLGSVALALELVRDNLPHAIPGAEQKMSHAKLQTPFPIQFCSHSA